MLTDSCYIQRKSMFTSSLEGPPKQKRWEKANWGHDFFLLHLCMDSSVAQLYGLQSQACLGWRPIPTLGQSLGPSESPFPGHWNDLLPKVVVKVQDNVADKASCLAHKYWKLSGCWIYEIILGFWETPLGNVLALNNLAEAEESLKMGSQDL